jgi:S-DNA-T family DNA segregation ATPase FtsK/SpoIIIE
MNAIDPVRITVDDSERRRDVTLQLRDEDATVGDIVAALGVSAADAPLVDGAPVSPQTPAVSSPLRRGSVVVLGPTSPTRSPIAPTALVRWVGGPDAGATMGLGPGCHIVGRAPGLSCRRNDPDVAPYHCAIEVDGGGDVELTPLVPMTRSPGERRWRIGTSVAEIGTAPTTARVLVPTGQRRRGEWSVPVARPPRPPLPRGPTAVGWPEPPPQRSPASNGGLIGALMTLLVSVVAAAALHEPALLLLGGIGALGTVGTGLVQRRRRARQAKVGRRRAADALRQFDAALAAQRLAVAQARWTYAVELPEAITRAVTGDARLWERRPHHDDFLEVVLGVGVVPWRPILDDGGERAEAAAVLARHQLLDDVPVVLPLRPGTVLGLVGDTTVARAVARSLLIQVAVTTGPADVAVRLFAANGDAEAWRWLSWLPHLVAADEAVECRASIVVVDDPDLLAARTSPARQALAGAFGPAAGIVIAVEAVALPATCTHIATVDHRACLALRDIATDSVVVPVDGAGASVRTVVLAARSLAGLDDPELTAAGGNVPHDVALADLLGSRTSDAHDLARAWTVGESNERGLPAAIGVGVNGVIQLDLVTHGPHALVAGTTGAGKSEVFLL